MCGPIFIFLIYIFFFSYFHIGWPSSTPPSYLHFVLSVFERDNLSLLIFFSICDFCKNQEVGIVFMTDKQTQQKVSNIFIYLCECNLDCVCVCILLIRTERLIGK